jgi:alpha-L-fucosidase 2
LSLLYRQPAEEWMQALPVGNGRLGAMIFGGIAGERIALNEITMWSGQPEAARAARSDGKQRRAEVVKAFIAGEYGEGHRLAAENLVVPASSFGSHVPVGDLIFGFDHDTSSVSDYVRELNLNDAVAKVSYRVNGVAFRREYFCSAPDNVLAIKLSADDGGKLNFDLGICMMRPSDATVFRTAGNSLTFSGKVCFPKFGAGGVRFAGKLTATTVGGKIIAGDTALRITDAREATVLLDIRTDYVTDEYLSLCEKTVDIASARKYEVLKNDHVSDYKRLFDRVVLSLGDATPDDRPTDLRLKHRREGGEDPGLDVLFFQYGRYLLIASSREDSPLPSNLQGLWNDNRACNMGWTCDYHLDINIEQNYWLSNVTNLHECNAPLFAFIRFLSERGAEMTRDIYGCRGWAANTVVNAWGYTAPADIHWGLFPAAGAWIASHLWTHYEYTRDKSFLATTAYPVLKGAAVFFLDCMTEDPVSGHLLTGPSISPENTFVIAGKHSTLSMMPTCDRILVYETYASCIRASEILGIDTAFRLSLTEAIKKLPPFKIGKHGTLQEWYHDFEEAQLNHRHTTHLLALYPFSQISPVRTPELAQAARKTIERRLNAPDWEDVEWSRANMINFYARLKDSRAAYDSYRILLRAFVRDNLLTVSPAGIAGAPQDIFIIDGNGAGTAGMAEMLIQSHEGYIEFLPALPPQWADGHFTGFCVRGGAEVSAKWKEGSIVEAEIKATNGNDFFVKIPKNGEKNLSLFLNGKQIEAEAESNSIIKLKLRKNETLLMQL